MRMSGTLNADARDGFFEGGFPGATYAAVLGYT